MRITVCAEIVRDGVEKSEIVSTSFVSSVIVSMMKESNHIMYIDDCHCSDHGCILRSSLWMVIIKSNLLVFKYPL